MKIHITNLYGQSYKSTAQKAQNATADIARKTLSCNELGIFCYDINADTPQMLSSRLDGIIAAISHGDTVIYQFPSWNGIRFDEAFMNRLGIYRGLKRILFLHDMPPLMFEDNRYLLPRYIDVCNKADLIIVPSQNMVDLLQLAGLTVEKTVVQEFWDFCVSPDPMTRPTFERRINFAGRPDNKKFSFVKNWNYDDVELDITIDREAWAAGKNIGFLGWFNQDCLLINRLRQNGGYGLVWTDDPYSREYMKLNANYKLSSYLAAGIPVIVHQSVAQSATVIRKNLGLAVESLEEAVELVGSMGKEEYEKMANSVETFADLIREGYFTKKVLTEAVYKLLYD